LVLIFYPPPEVRGPNATGSSHPLYFDEHTLVTVDGGPCYICQKTGIVRAATQLQPRGLGLYLRELAGGNVGLVPILVILSTMLFNGTQWRLSGALWPEIKTMDSNYSPYKSLGLQPGQVVRVKSKHAIKLTLNRKFRNRGLKFGSDMLFCFGGSYRVAARVTRIVHEGTGERLLFKAPSIIL
jgi:hypothetical protein